MKLGFESLQGHLQRGLLASYLVTGDEPLQAGEAADAIRAKARQAGFETRTILDVNQYFKWGEFRTEADSLSLFSDKKIIDLRIPSGKPGLEGSKALVAYAGNPPPDTLLLITLPKLDRNQNASKWVKALDKLGVILQIWPVEGVQLASWLDKRMRAKGLEPEKEVAGMLAERVEGNLLAASQEIDKLLLLHGEGTIDVDQLLAATTDSARFDVFKLVDAALEGKAARAVRILEGLHAEGMAETLVLWALARETRMLTSIRAMVENGIQLQQAIGSRRDVWQQRRPLVTQAVKRLSLLRLQGLLKCCALADRAIKGRASDDPWVLFEEILVELAGVRLRR